MLYNIRWLSERSLTAALTRQQESSHGTKIARVISEISHAAWNEQTHHTGSLFFSPSWQVGDSRCKETWMSLQALWLIWATLLCLFQNCQVAQHKYHHGSVLTADMYCLALQQNTNLPMSTYRPAWVRINSNHISEFYWERLQSWQKWDKEGITGSALMDKSHVMVNLLLKRGPPPAAAHHCRVRFLSVDTFT